MPFKGFLEWGNTGIRAGIGIWKSASNVGLDIGSAGVNPVLSGTPEFEVKILPDLMRSWSYRLGEQLERAEQSAAQEAVVTCNITEYPELAETHKHHGVTGQPQESHHVPKSVVQTLSDLWQRRGEPRGRPRTCGWWQSRLRNVLNICSESFWGFPLAGVIVSGVTGFALGDKKVVFQSSGGKGTETGSGKEAAHLLSALSSLIENQPEITEIYSSGGWATGNSSN